MDLDSGDAINVLGVTPVQSEEDLKALEQVLWEINKGRIDCWVHEAEGVVGEDKSLQCYVTVKFGKVSKKGDFYRKTKTTKKKVTDGAPKFGDELLHLTLRDLKKLWKTLGWSKEKEEEEIKLTVTVYDDNYLKDVVIGEVEIGLRDLLLRPATTWKQWWSLGESKGKILLTLQFLSVYEGLLRMNLMEGVGLVKPDLVGDADVYVTIKVRDCEDEA